MFITQRHSSSGVNSSCSRPCYWLSRSNLALMDVSCKSFHGGSSGRVVWLHWWHLQSVSPDFLKIFTIWYRRLWSPDDESLTFLSVHDWIPWKNEDIPFSLSWNSAKMVNMINMIRNNRSPVQFTVSLDIWFVQNSAFCVVEFWLQARSVHKRSFFRTVKFVLFCNLRRPAEGLETEKGWGCRGWESEDGEEQGDSLI